MRDDVSRSFDVDGNSYLVRKDAQSKWWVLYAMLTMIFWGMMNFGFGIVAEFGQSGANLSAVVVFWISSGAIGLASLLSERHVIETHCRSEVLWCFFSGAFACLATLSVSLAMAALPQGKGAIVAVKPTQCFIVSILSFVFYQEKLTLLQMLGMSGAVVGLAMMVLADIGESAFVGLSLGFLCAQSFGVCNVISKHVTSHSANPMSPAQATAYQTLFTGFVGAFALATMFASGRGLEGLRNEQSWLILVACCVSLVGFLGNVSLGVAFQRGGPGGVTVTIANSQAMVVLVLDMIFFTPNLDPSVLCGMAVVICSVGFLMAVSDRMEKNSQAAGDEQR